MTGYTKGTNAGTAVVNKISGEVSSHDSSLSAHSSLFSSKADKVGTLSDLQAILNGASSGDVIRLSSDYVYDATSDSGLTDLELKINTPVVIYGNGHTVDFGSVAHGLDITAGSSNNHTKIYDLILRNALDINDSDSSCVYVSGSIYVDLINCKIIENAGNGLDTSIYSHVALTNCVIMDCWGYGISNNGYMTLTNCKVMDNHYIGIFNVNNCTIRECVITGNATNIDTSVGEIIYEDNNNHHTHTTSQLSDWSAATSNFLTSHQDISGKLNTAQGSANASKNVVTDSSGNITVEAKPTIPSKTSDLTNDSGFLTSHQSLSGYLQSSDIANDLTITTSGKVLDARQGKALNDLIGSAITYINQ